MECLLSSRHRPIEYFASCSMRIIVSCHLHASTAVCPTIKKAIELITLEDVGIFSMNFLEGCERLEC